MLSFPSAKLILRSLSAHGKLGNTSISVSPELGIVAKEGLGWYSFGDASWNGGSKGEGWEEAIDEEDIVIGKVGRLFIEVEPLDPGGDVGGEVVGMGGNRLIASFDDGEIAGPGERWVVGGKADTSIGGLRRKNWLISGRTVGDLSGLPGESPRRLGVVSSSEAVLGMIGRAAAGG